ncbi:transport protein Sec24-like [Thalictrum thalictroides]|uniref:Transport protein Sec24-like n=1 Tax=Thalictrum thalictroides TaxID=46969 RepID=A0A7J6X6T8_THATH|nr:transport protein Sec24-like [Thalictrum thalictroides]
MEPPIQPGMQRPGFANPNYNPNYQQRPPPPSALADNMQNLQINRGPPTTMGGPGSFGPGPRPPPPFGSSPFMSSAPPGNPLPPNSVPPLRGPPSSQPQFTGASPVSRPGQPPSGFPRMPPPVSAPQQTTHQPNLGPGRLSGPPFSQAPPGGTRPFPGPYSSAAPASGPTSPPSSVQGPFMNGPPIPARGNMPTGPPFSVGSNQQPPGGPPLGVTPRGPMGPTMRPFTGPQLGHAQQPLPPFSVGSQSMIPPPGSPYGSQMGQMPPPPQGFPPMQGAMPPPGLYGMPPPPSLAMGPTMGHMPGSGGLSAGSSKIDPNQIPRPFPTSSGIVFETRVNGQANIPPPASSEYVVKDTGNCSPRYMRCTINQIPCTGDLLSTSSMQLALMVQPFALPHPSEEQIQLVDFGEGGPVRCSRCKGYINPFMKFIDQGRRFICNLCGFADETPREYHCNLGPDGRRRDADERPELCRGTVEFVATKEFMVRDPMPAVFFFLVDVSMNAIQTGATAAACSAINQAIAVLPEGPRTMVGFATFDSTIHFYNLKRALQQPLMLIVPDVQDVYTPLQTDVIVQLSECRQHLEQLLESIPTMFQSNKVAESAFGAAAKAAFLAMKNTGGKLLVFQSVLPSIGIGALSAREMEGRTNVSAGEKEVQKLLQPADKTLKTMALEFAEYQVCVDIFVTSQTYVDIASISVVPSTTGGQVYYYYPFSALSDSGKLHNDLKWNVTRPQGFEAVMRVRCSQGLQVQEYSGSFCKRIPTDVDLPAIDSDKTIMVTFKHDDKLVEGTECAFQCAVLYTTIYGERRIRVTTLSLPCTSVLSNLFRAADLDAQFANFLKQVANEIPTKPLIQVKEQVINKCVNILTAYRKFCATVSSSGQLILPEALKLLPLYTLALVKSIGLRTDARLDDQAYWVNRVTSLPIPLTVPLVYPRMMAIHNLLLEEDTGSVIPPIVPLSSEHLTEDGIYFLESGEDGLIYVGKEASSDVLQQIFGVASFDKIPTQFVLQQYDNELSRRLNDLVNEIRSQRCSYLRLRLCKKGDSSETFFFSYMVEDKSHASPSYVEFLVHIHRQIQTKMA